jgi:hypothetical protein
MIILGSCKNKEQTPKVFDFHPVLNPTLKPALKEETKLMMILFFWCAHPIQSGYLSG